ncbi:MAG: hypothetical protein DA328_08945 [Nitrososphaeraceae archaeon]|nr:hypothetical protein [Nitrososphaeraceae archaeon]
MLYRIWGFYKSKDILLSGYSCNSTWTALKKAWKAFKIHKSNFDTENQRKYARIIQKLERELGEDITPFDDLGLRKFSYYR